MIALQNWEFDLQASHLEIYNENIRDLLAAATSGSDATRLQDQARPATGARRRRTYYTRGHAGGRSSF